MALRSINTIKNWFRTGLKPTQSQFWDWMDSYFHKDEDIPSGQIEGLQGLLDSKMDKAAVIAPEQVGEYDPGKNYIFDPQLAEYVSFSNPESEDPRFRVEAFYRLKESPGQAGRSPESHPEFWVYQGQTLGDITIGDVIGLREELDDLSQKKSGLIAVVDAGKIGTDFLLEKVDDTLVVLVPGQIGIEDGTQTVFYLDITEPSFVVKTGIGFTEEDYKVLPLSPRGSKTYSIDFGTTSIVAQEINMFGAAVIDNIIASNIASILLSYSGGLQEVITPGVNSIAITAGDILTWEITRTNAGQLATLGITYH